MRSRWMTVAVAPVVALSLNCSDGTGPTQDELEELLLAFCGTDVPVWMGMQNDGGAWTRVTGDANNAFHLDVTPRFALATTHLTQNGYVTDVYYTTADEVRPLSGVACLETSGTKTVNGSVSNVAVGEQALVSMGSPEAVVTPPATGWSLSGVATIPQDLVAHRFSATSGVPNRVIIRRAENPVNNATLPVLDFANQGQAIATNTATVTGLAAGDNNYYDIAFLTATGSAHFLFALDGFTSTSQALYGVPSALTQAGDAHRLSFNADASSGVAYRTVLHTTRLPGDKIITFGAALSTPTISTVGTTPYARMRAQLPAQPDYMSFATAFFVQSTRSFFVTVSNDYVEGAVTTWNLEVPDVTAASGFPAGAGLQSGVTTSWFVEAYDGTLSAYIGSTPVDGSTVRYAGRSSSTTSMQLYRANMRASEQRAQLLRRAFPK